MVAAPATKLAVEGLKVSYGAETVLHGIDLEVHEHEIFGIIGPAGSGKTSFLRALNRMDELDPKMSVEGTVRFNGRDVMQIRNVYAFRRRIGVVFPLPVGLPLTIYENVAFAPRLAGIKDKARLDEIVERCLRRAALWDEVKDRLKPSEACCPVGSSSGSRSPARSRRSPSCFCSTSFRSRSIR